MGNRDFIEESLCKSVTYFYILKKQKTAMSPGTPLSLPMHVSDDISSNIPAKTLIIGAFESQRSPLRHAYDWPVRKGSAREDRGPDVPRPGQ